MKILFLSDRESESLWDYYDHKKIAEYDLIVSCGDLKAEYLSFLCTLGNVPVFYVPGNHDSSYEKYPPEGCDLLDDQILTFRGLRIMGLGGSMRYAKGRYQYTEEQMRKRVQKLIKKVKRIGGVDIVVTHAAPAGYGDDTDLAHRGFTCFLDLLREVKPKYLVHGHVHLNYGHNIQRVHQYESTTIINAYERYPLEIDIPEPLTDTNKRLSPKQLLMQAQKKVRGY